MIATPIKSGNVPPTEAVAASLLRPDRQEEPSIYAALGWDDDDE
jgi:hypothetical protein